MTLGVLMLRVVMLEPRTLQYCSSHALMILRPRVRTRYSTIRYGTIRYDTVYPLVIFVAYITSSVDAPCCDDLTLDP